MNFLSVKTPVKNAFRPASRRVALPMSIKLTIPAGLDWVIKQRLTSVIAHALLDSRSTAQRVDELCRLDKVLSQHRDIQEVILYGYELSLLHSFLMEQERGYAIWSPVFIPQRASLTILAQLRAILPWLRMLCRQVDCYADRPFRAR